MSESVTDSDIAIVGMVGRFPQADNIEAFWENLKNRKDTVTFFSEEELLEAGARPEHIRHPNYVKANQVLSDVELFDADFFGFTGKEVEIMDPQQRIFLECAHEVLEHAGYNPETYEGLIGVYCGVGMNTYILDNLSKTYKDSSSVEHYQLMLANDKDYLATRVSYKLNLKGPSVNINTACSTSLVAIHLACLSLLNGECDMALTGSAHVRVPQVAGYLHQEGMIFSPDGHCRAFDERAEGTLLGNGAGAALLKRLTDAVADRDTVHAVIKGSAINNDGSLKAGYTAPGLDGQRAVIADTQSVSGVDAETVTYVEAHGTGTHLGDPVEITALSEAFRKQTDKRGFCALGSVKSNIGHLDAAAGMAGLIKTVLMLEHRTLIPSLHYEASNPDIDFENSPFFVQTELEEWRSSDHPRRAGVSAFGIGGTNAHVILEEAQVSEEAHSARETELLILSAKTKTALDRLTTNFAGYLKRHPDLRMGDVAYTLSVGRKAQPYRKFLVCRDAKDAALTLALSDESRIFSGCAEPPVTMEEALGDDRIDPAIADRIRQNQTAGSLDLSSLFEGEADTEALLRAAGFLWLAGVDMDWERFHRDRPLRRVPLPTYPFERKRYWVESDGKQADAKTVDSEFLETIREAAPAGRKNIVIGKLQKQIASMLGGDTPLPDPERNLMELHLDSLILIEIIAKLGIELNLAIPSSALIEYPTISSFADHVLLTLGFGNEEQAEEKSETSQDRRSRRDAMGERRKLRQNLRGGVQASETVK